MPRYANSKVKDTLRRLRREEIETAALRTVLKRGFPDTSLRQVAKEGKIPLAILHYYFKDKNELMRCVAQRMFDASMQMAQVRERESDPVRRVEAVLENYVMQSTEHWQAMLAFVEYWAACARKGNVDRFYTQVHFGYRQVLSEGLREAGAADPDGLALALLAMMTGYVTFYRSKEPDPAEREAMLARARAMVEQAVCGGRTSNEAAQWSRASED